MILGIDFLFRTAIFELLLGKQAFTGSWILCVRIQYRGEPLRVCIVLQSQPSNKRGARHTFLCTQTIQTSLYFLTFGQMARQPAFNQGNWQKNTQEKPQQQKNSKFWSKLDKLLCKIHLINKNSTEKFMLVRGSLITSTKINGCG